MMTEYRVLAKELKILLKAKGLTYCDLAEELKMSEAGIKRIFGAKDGKLSTLTRVSEAIGLSFVDLVQASQLSQTKITYFNDEQDHALAEDFSLYAFFNELVIRRKTPDEISNEHGIPRATVEKYLRKLERLEIVRKTIAGHIRSRLTAPIGIRQGSQLRRKLQRFFLPSLAEAIFDPEIPDSMRFLQTREWSMTRENIERFKIELDELVKKYDGYAARDEKLGLSLITVSLGVAGLLGVSPYRDQIKSTSK